MDRTRVPDTSCIPPPLLSMQALDRNAPKTEREGVHPEEEGGNRRSSNSLEPLGIMVIQSRKYVFFFLYTIYIIE